MDEQPKHTSSLLKLLRRLDQQETSRGAEIGVWRGETSHWLLRRYEGLYLYLVDKYEPYKKWDKTVRHRRWVSAQGMRRARRAAKYNIKDYQDRKHWLMLDSVDAAKHVKNESLDFIFIDAHHGYESVKGDIVAWVPKVKPGGIVSGHDYPNDLRRHRRHVGVGQAVDEHMEQIGGQLKMARFNIWYYEKDRHSYDGSTSVSAV